MSARVSARVRQFTKAETVRGILFRFCVFNIAFGCPLKADVNARGKFQ